MSYFAASKTSNLLSRQSATQYLTTYSIVLTRYHPGIFNNSVVLSYATIVVRALLIYDTCHHMYKPANDYELAITNTLKRYFDVGCDIDPTSHIVAVVA